MQDSEPEPANELAPTGLRDARGRFIVGNRGRLTHGAHSEQRSLALAPIRHELRASILSAKGFSEEDVDPAWSMIADQLIEARMIARTYFQFLEDSGGPISAKGRQRRAVEGYLRASDRVAKFASMLGLERRQTNVTETPAQWAERTIREREEAREHTDDEPKADQ